MKGRRIASRAEALAAIEAVQTAIRKQLDPRITALEKRQREQEQRRELLKSIVDLADRIEAIEKRSGSTPGSSEQARGRWAGLL